MSMLYVRQYHSPSAFDAFSIEAGCALLRIRRSATRASPRAAVAQYLREREGEIDVKRYRPLAANVMTTSRGANPQLQQRGGEELRQSGHAG
jgi:hypothetical protein